MSSGTRVVVDTCVIVNVLTNGGNDDPSWLPHSRDVLRAGDEGKLDVYVSAITVAEVLANGKVRGKNLPAEEREARIAKASEWLAAGSTTTIEADHRLATQAGNLGQTHQLSGADALVLASALRVRATNLYTWDRGLLKVGTSIEGLAVTTPEGATDPDIFTATYEPA